jgi:putative lipoic acid-binding regulatory protein
VVSEEGTKDPQAAEELLKFPVDYPIKIVGRASDELRAHVHAVMLRHVPDLDPDRMSERLSEEGKYLSITYTIVAQSREQVVGLVNDLKATEGVMMII